MRERTLSEGHVPGPWSKGILQAVLSQVVLRWDFTVMREFPLGTCNLMSKPPLASENSCGDNS